MRPENFPITEVVKKEYGIGIEPGMRTACFFHNGDNPTALRYFRENNTFKCYTNCGSINSVRAYAMARGIDVTTKERYQRARQEMAKVYGLQPQTAEEEQQIRKEDVLAECVSIWHSALTEGHWQSLTVRGIKRETGQSQKIGFCKPGIVSEDKLNELGIGHNFDGYYIFPGYFNGVLRYFIAGKPVTTDHWEYKKPPSSHWTQTIIGETGGADSPTLEVEGIFDMLTTLQAGFSCVCTLGAEPTKTQLAELSKIQDLILLTDKDKVGEKAREELSKELFPSAKVGDISALGECKDLNELYCTKGEEEFRQVLQSIIDEAEDVLDKALKEYESTVEKDPRRAGKFIYDEIVPLLGKLPPGEKEATVTLISKKTKAVGIGLRELKKAVGSQELDGQEGEPPKVEILETVPDLIDQPLALIRDKVYAVTQVWVSEKIDEQITKLERRFVVSSDGEVVPLNEAEKKFNVTITLKDLPIPSLLLSGKVLNAFREGYRPGIVQVFDNIVAFYDRFIDFSWSYGSQEQMSKLSACLSMMTWFRLGTETLPYAWPNGPGGSGKTQWGLIWARTSFLGQCILDMSSFASIRNDAGMGASLMFDDAENLTDPRDRSKNDIRTLFLSGYRKGSSIKIQEKNGNDKWASLIINTYCPKAFTAIKIPSGALATRVIVIPLIKSIDKEKTKGDPTNPILCPFDWETLKDDLWLSALLYLPEAQSINNELNSETELTGRDFERWKPILMVARLLEQQGKVGLEEEIREIMALYFKDEASDITSDEKIPLIVEELEKLFDNKPLSEKEVKFSVSEFTTGLTLRAREAGILPDDKSYSPKLIGKLLQSLRTKDERTKKGRYRRVTRDIVTYLKKVFLENKFLKEGVSTSDNSRHQDGEPRSINRNEDSHLMSSHEILMSPSNSCHPETELGNPTSEFSDPPEEPERDMGELPDEFPLTFNENDEYPF